MLRRPRRRPRTEARTPTVTEPGYRAGQRPGNYGRRFPVEVLTAAELGRLLAACPKRGPRASRDRALIVALWRGGLRVGEAVALYPKDIDPSSGTIVILRGKGSKRRTIGIDPGAMAVLERWLAVRRELGIDGQVPLFCTVFSHQFAHPMRTALVRGLLKRAGRRAGIEKRVHPHALRHTHAFELANEGVPVHLIQLQLGHNSLRTTERYVRHIAPMELIRAMQARRWSDGGLEALELSLGGDELEQVSGADAHEPIGVEG